MPRGDREAKRAKRNKAIIGIITIFVMVSGGFAIFADSLGGSNQNIVEYNGFEFEQNVQGMWDVEIDDMQLSFPYHPLELENMVVTGDPTIVLGKEIYLTNDPNSRFAVPISRAQESYSIFSDAVFGEVPMHGFSTETEFEVPLITCENATDMIPVMSFEEGNESIIVEGNCVVLKSDEELGYTRLVVRLLYSLLGVM
jgi:hypothetical protein